MEFTAACQFSGCTEEDFMPAKCAHCHLKFCRHHVTSIAHSCPAAPTAVAGQCPKCNSVISYHRNTTETLAQALVRHQSSSDCARAANGETMTLLQSCQHPGCTKKEIVAIHCDGCDKRFCVEHRVLEKHRCPLWIQRETIRKAEVERRRQETARREAAAALARKGCQNTVDSAFGLRPNAAGSKPDEDDVVVRVHVAQGLRRSTAGAGASSSSCLPAYFAFPSHVCVGRILDAVSLRFGVPNSNHTTTDPSAQLWLHLVHSENGGSSKPIPPSARIGDWCAKAQEDLVLMRGQDGSLTALRAGVPTVVAMRNISSPTTVALQREASNPSFSESCHLMAAKMNAAASSSQGSSDSDDVECH